MFNYFKNEGFEFAYYLLELDGKQRSEKLEITTNLFRSKKLFNKWYVEVSEKLELIDIQELKELAKEELNKIKNQIWK